MKINLKEITRAINENEYAPEKKWQYETITFIESIDTIGFGKMDKYEVTVRIKAGKYDNNGIKYQINHYVDEEVYTSYWNGTCFLG